MIAVLAHEHAADHRRAQPDAAAHQRAQVEQAHAGVRAAAGRRSPPGPAGSSAREAARTASRSAVAIASARRTHGSLRPHGPRRSHAARRYGARCEGRPAPCVAVTGDRVAGGVRPDEFAETNTVRTPGGDPRTSVRTSSASSGRKRRVKAESLQLRWDSALNGQPDNVIEIPRRALLWATTSIAARQCSAWLSPTSATSTARLRGRTGTASTSAARCVGSAWCVRGRQRRVRGRCDRPCATPGSRTASRDRARRRRSIWGAATPLREQRSARVPGSGQHSYRTDHVNRSEREATTSAGVKVASQACLRLIAPGRRPGHRNRQTAVASWRSQAHGHPRVRSGHAA